MRIALVEDHKIIRKVLGDFIKGEFKFEVVEFNNGVEAINQIKSQPFDLVITDINMPKMDGVELLKAIKQYDPELKVIALSMMDDFVTIKRMISGGVSGYVLKEGNSQELVKAINDVMKGNNYYSPLVTELMVKDGIKDRLSHGKELTKRELEILRMLFEEMSHQEIAEALHISQRTVETHKYNIMEKTGSKNMAGLVRYAIRKKIFDDLFY